MKKNKIEPFNDFFYRSCIYNSLFPIIKKYNRSIDLFLFNDVGTFDFNEDRDSIEVKYLSQKGMSELLDDSGIKVKGYMQIDNIENKIIESITDSKDVILWIDSYYESFRKDTFLIEHLSHTLLVYDYNLDEKEFHIIEHDNRDRLTYKRRKVSFNVLKDCYEGYLQNFGYNNNLCTYYEFCLKDVNPPAIILRKDFFNMFCKNHLKHEEKLTKNILVIREYIERLISDIKSSYSYKELFEKEIRVVNEIINMRKIEAYKINKLFKSNRINSIMNELLDSWNYVRAKMGIYLMLPNPKFGVIDSLLVMLKKIPKLENDYTVEIISIAKKDNAMNLE